MAHVKTTFNNRFFIPLFTIVAKLAGLFKVSYIIGSWTALFSAASCIIPLSGAFGGAVGATGFFVLTFSYKLLILKSLPLKFLAYHIPGYFASLYWAVNSRLFRFLVPFICFLLFILHPVGAQAFPYACYWFIPMIIQCIPSSSLFVMALGSTFTAHAVGSVIWLYALPMAPAVWIGLIPVVFCERMVFAVGMVGMHHLISWVGSAANCLPLVSRRSLSSARLHS